MEKNIKKVNHESDIKNFNKGTLLFDNKKSNCMKKVINFSSFLFILLFISNSLFAQFSLHIGAGVPTGDFAADDISEEDDGLSGTGFNAGWEYLTPLVDSSGLNLFLGGDLFVNNISDNAKDDMEEGISSDTDIEFPMYVYIPVTVGLNYTFDIDQSVKFFGKAGVSANFLKMTDYIIEDAFYKTTVTYNPSASFGFLIGGGIILKDKFIIAANYLALGEHDIDGNIESDVLGLDIDGEIDGFKRNVSIIKISFGIIL